MTSPASKNRSCTHDPGALLGSSSALSRLPPVASFPISCWGHFVTSCPPSLHGPVTSTQCSLSKVLRKVLPNFLFASRCDVGFRQCLRNVWGTLQGTLCALPGFQGLGQWCHLFLIRKKQAKLVSGVQRHTQRPLCSDK